MTTETTDEKDLLETEHEMLKNEVITLCNSIDASMARFVIKTNEELSEVKKLTSEILKSLEG